MKTIPQVRTALKLVATEVDQLNPNIARRIRGLILDMYRRPAVRKVKTESVEFTPELGRKIKAFARNNPNKSYKRIANRFNVSIGRVSEALAGKRAA